MPTKRPPRSKRSKRAARRPPTVQHPALGAGVRHPGETCGSLSGAALARHRKEINAFWRRCTDQGMSVEVGLTELGCISDAWTFVAGSDGRILYPADAPVELPGYELRSRYDQAVELFKDSRSKQYCARVWVKEMFFLAPEGSG